jgi:hypothetical protein
MVAVISGADNGSLFMPSGVLTFSRPFAILSFYRKQDLLKEEKTSFIFSFSITQKRQETTKNRYKFKIITTNFQLKNDDLLLYVRNGKPVRFGRFFHGGKRERGKAVKKGWLFKRTAAPFPIF